jgi:hypothetical protein
MARTPALAQRAVKSRWKLRGSTGLALAPFFERCGADLGQRQRGIGGLGLGLPPQQVPADALKLPGDPELTCVDVDLVPAQAERLPAAQPEDQDRYVAGVERVVVPPGALKEPPASSTLQGFGLCDRALGTRTNAATLRATSPSRTALPSAIRKVPTATR